MSHKSEEQWEEIGTCPVCDTPLYMKDGKVKGHKCIDELESFVYEPLRPLNFEAMAKTILNFN